jgi:glycosyltransferase involved in cell wall biosynthesis
MLQAALKSEPPRRIMMTVDAVGGVWRYALDLGRALTGHGIDVLLIGLGPRPSEKQLAEANSVAGLDVQWTDLPLDWLVADPAELRQIPMILAEIAEQSRVDLVHFNLPSQCAHARLTKPTIVVAHSCMATWWMAVHRGEPLPVSWRWHCEWTAAGLNDADVVIAPSDSHARALESCYGELPGLRVVCNGSSRRCPNLAKQSFVFSAGRWWDEAKNLQALDAAAPACDWSVFAAGPLDGPDGHRQAPRNVRVLGELTRECMDEWLARAEIFVSPSFYEPFGLAVLEAAQASCALVLSDIPTFREFWEGAALFVDPHSPGSISAAVNDLAKDPIRRGELAQAARRRARCYSIGVQAGAMMEVYAEALKTESISLGALY